MLNFCFLDLYRPSHHTSVSHQLAAAVADSNRLSTTVPANPNYENKYELSNSYSPTSLFPPVSSVGTSHVTHHQVSTPVATPATTYQQPISHHQLSPTPNTLISIMGATSSNSTPSTSDQITPNEINLSSTSPIHHHVQHLPTPQQQPLPTNPENEASNSWNLPITSSSRVTLPPTPPTSLAQHSQVPTHHQSFASHYSTGSFQQSARVATTHQPFYGWY